MTFTVKIVTNPKSSITGLVVEDLEDREFLRKRMENGRTEMVVQELKHLDIETNKKYFELISIFASPKFSMPEPLERFLGLEGVEAKSRRIDDCREAIMYHIGYRKKSIIRIDGQLIRGETGMSLREIPNIEQHIEIYAQTRDWIFAQLRKWGWDDKALQDAFGCLFLGIPKNDYDKIYKNPYQK
jgi:hypothetical protein